MEDFDKKQQKTREDIFKLVTFSTKESTNKKSSNFEVIAKKKLSEMVDYYKRVVFDNHKELAKNKTPISVTKITSLTSGLMKHYGEDYYKFLMKRDYYFPDLQFLSKHGLDLFTRARIVDWMLEVFNSYFSEPSCFYNSVNLFDIFLYKFNGKLNTDEIQLAGMCCIFMTSKMEDIIPLHINHIKENIGFNKYSEDEIRKMEATIINTLNFNIMSVSTYDFVQTFLCDFWINNEKSIETLHVKTALIIMETLSYFFTKMIYICAKFNKYPHVLKAIAILKASFDMIKTNSNVPKTVDKFIEHWFRYLIKETQVNQSAVEDIYSRIIKLYTQSDQLSKIAPTLYSSSNLSNIFNPKKM